MQSSIALAKYEAMLIEYSHINPTSKERNSLLLEECPCNGTKQVQKIPYPTSFMYRNNLRIK